MKTTRTLRPTKAIMNLLNEYETELYKKGFFPEVNYHDSRGSSESMGVVSFNLFERVDVGRLLFKCLHFNLLRDGIEYGAFTRQHSKSFLDYVQIILGKMNPVTSEKLKKYPLNPNNRGIKLWGIEEKFKFREGEVAKEIYMDDCIFDFACEETNGYFAETGSAYIWEIAMLQVDGIWCPFHLSAEEKEIKKR